MQLEPITILLDVIDDNQVIYQLLSAAPERFHWVSSPVEQPIDVIVLSAPDELHVIEQRLEHLQPLCSGCPIIVLTPLMPLTLALTLIQQKGVQECLAHHQLQSQALLRAIDYALARHQWDHLVSSELRLLHRVIQSSHNSIVLTDARQADNPIIYVNKAFERLTGYSAQVCLGHNCRFLHRQDRAQRAIEEMRQAIEEQRSIQVLLRNYRQDGSLFWNEVFIAPIYDEDNQLAYFIGILNEVSMLHPVQNQPVDLQQQMHRFLERLTPLPISASLFNSLSLSQADPELFNELVRYYTELLSLRLEQQLYKTQNERTIQLKNILVEQLGFLKAGPRDVIEIHSAALKMRQAQGAPQKMLAYHQEGQFLVLELMGSLVSYYRNNTLGANSFIAPNIPKS